MPKKSNLFHYPAGGSLRVIAGVADGVSGPVVGIAADPTYLDIRLDAGEEFSRQVEPSYTLLAYLYRGGANFGEGSARESGGPRRPPAGRLRRRRAGSRACR